MGDRVDERPQRLDGMVQYNAFPPNAAAPRIKNFSQRYKAKYGENQVTNAVALAVSHFRSTLGVDRIASAIVPT